MPDCRRIGSKQGASRRGLTYASNVEAKLSQASGRKREKSGKGHNDVKRIFQTTISMLLVVMLLALSGLAIAGLTHDAGATGLAQVFSGTGGTSSGQTQGNSDKPSPVLQPPAQTSQGGLIDARTAVRRTGPAVVTVINNLDAGNSQPNPLGGQIAPSASGSGVVVDQRGYIVTNNHVVAGEKSIQVIFADSKEKVNATLVGTDPFSDLAVIKVDRNVGSVAQFGDSDTIEPGQPVVAIGSALGDFRNTVTAGVVSALHRDLDDPQSPALRDLIQTDAAINHGNSGGPLLDIDGNVIGINVAVVRGAGMGSDVAEGLGFAIPANTARAVVDQLVSKGAVERPFIGISYQPITPQIAAYYNLALDHGILVSEVVENGPAAKAGIKANSIITKFDGVDLTTTTSLLQVLMKHKVGDTVKLSVLAPGALSETEVSVTLTNRPSGQ